MLQPCLNVASCLRRSSPGVRTKLELAVIESGVLPGPESPAEISEISVGGVNSFQMPNQLAPFLVHLAQYGIKNYLEVGSFLGGTFYIVDTYLRLTQPEYIGGTALDIVDRMQGFQEYCAVYPATRFHEIRSLDFVPEQVYDLVFLDGDHTYDYLRQEFAHFLPHARLIALHDIVSTHPHCPGTRRFWNEIKGQYPHHEFTDQYPGQQNVMGIGLIETELGERRHEAPHQAPTKTAAVDEILADSGFGVSRNS
jgi:hypothetical protein